MTTVVPTSDEDPALSVFRFVSDLSWSDAGPDVAEPQVTRLCLEAEELIALGKWSELAKLIVPSAEVIFSKVSEKDVESIFTIICNLVTKTENPEEVKEIVKVIIPDKPIPPQIEKPAVRLKIWINLYNLLEAPDSRFYVYNKALELAVVGKVTEYIIPSFKKIDTFLKDWKIGIPDQRELFLTISNILKDNKSTAKDSLKFLTNYLATFNGEDANVLEKAKEGAVRAIVEFVKALDTFQVAFLIFNLNDHACLLFWLLQFSSVVPVKSLVSRSHARSRRGGSLRPFHVIGRQNVEQVAATLNHSPFAAQSWQFAGIAAGMSFMKMKPH